MPRASRSASVAATAAAAVPGPAVAPAASPASSKPSRPHKWLPGEQVVVCDLCGQHGERDPTEMSRHYNKHMYVNYFRGLLNYAINKSLEATHKGVNLYGDKIWRVSRDQAVVLLGEAAVTKLFSKQGASYTVMGDGERMRGRVPGAGEWVALVALSQDEGKRVKGRTGKAKEKKVQEGRVGKGNGVAKKTSGFNHGPGEGATRPGSGRLAAWGIFGAWM
ncbi:uncharacterized protein AB675_1671 [Cyphellophora attinorum]|uniref:Uncharacterized protein n=1 Tax=Cyphellophora attinorum TaxID=1664694 RepID=A0A0N0NJ15_9EURO|nr:uncharacterized protein AB675_1671 [Phialophora attinorum]KPI36079.1 hypothetical protein AB675_1671 [Phialophora attinorum]